MPHSRVVHGRGCVGGPLDGLEAQSSEATFRWLDAGGECHDAPGPGRALYQRGVHERDTRWHYTGPAWGQCGGCGAILEPIANGQPQHVCRLCGGAALSHLPDA